MTVLRMRWDGERRARGVALLREVAAEALGVAADDVRLGADRCPDCGREHGAPHARSGDRTASLSLAHAGHASVAAASTLGRVGVDALRVDERTGPGLAGLLPDVAPEDRPRHWTRVEAVLKADGRGLRIAPSRIRFADDGRSARLDGRRYLLRDSAVDGLLVTLAEERAADG